MEKENEMKAFVAAAAGERRWMGEGGGERERA